MAGSIDYLGAALLTVRAAYRAGAGLVRLAVPTSLQPMIAGRVVEAVTIGLPETDIVGEVDASAALDQLLDLDHDAAVIGPGLRPGLSTVDLVLDFLSAAGERSPVVVDAEALNSLSTIGAWWERVARPCVLTPHVGELKRLISAAGEPFGVDVGDLTTDDEARATTASRAAVAWGQVVVLKGARTVIAGGEPDPAAVMVAPYENPALATAGTGDVLAGTIGAMLAQGCPPVDAARIGVYLHGAAGEVARERYGGTGVVASDLPDEIARVRRRLELVAERARSGRRLGFAVGTREDEPDAASDRVGSGILSHQPGAIEARLAAAGLPPLPRLTWLEIDQDALSSNVRVIRRLAGPRARIAAVVKADGYGHGLEVAARSFLAGGASLLCVATLDEAIALRAGGIEAPILVLYAIPPEAAPAAALSGVELVAAEAGSLAATLAAWRAWPGAVMGDASLRFHLEIETGLARAGFRPEAAGVAAASIAATPGAELAGLWSHLASSHDADASARQLERFADRGGGARLGRRRGPAAPPGGHGRPGGRLRSQSRDGPAGPGALR